MREILAAWLLMVLIGVSFSAASQTDHLPGSITESFFYQAILFGNQSQLCSLDKKVSKSDKEIHNGSSCKGFPILRQFRMSHTEWKNLKFVFLLEDTYLKGIVRSCYFVPDIALVITLEQKIKGNDTVFILVSRSCRKIFASFTNDLFNGNDGEFFELSERGYERINGLVNGIVDQFNDFESFKSSDISAPLDDVNMDFGQLIIMNNLLRSKNSKAIQFLHAGRYFSITDTLIVDNGKIDRLGLVLDEVSFEYLIRNDTLLDIQRLMRNNVIKVKRAPLAAEIVDVLPPENASDEVLAEFYLKRIGAIIANDGKLRSKFSTEKYLNYEKNQNIAHVKSQIESRKVFIKYLYKLK